MKKLLEDLRHELNTLHGLWASDDPGRGDDERAWRLDTKPLLERIDEVLAIDEGLSLSKRIEAAYDEAVQQRRAMLEARDAMTALEAGAKHDHADEWAGAKNNDVRAVLLHGWLGAEDDYLEALDDHEGARMAYRLALLEIERLRLLVEARKAEGGQA